MERKSIYQYIIFEYDITNNRGKEHKQMDDLLDCVSL